MRFPGILLLALLVPILAPAQTLPLSIDYTPDGIDQYDTSIPKPEAIIQHVVGTSHSRPDQIVRYFEAVDEVSDRVRLVQHGWTYENRPLIHAVVTSPANHRRLDEIKMRNAQLSDEPGSIRDEDLAGMPVVVYQGFSVHGNEASGADAALVYLYYLAAGQGKTIDDVLENTVLIVDPLFNPDGRSRFVQWVNQNRGGTSVSDTQDREHSEPWPGGRTNHYYFDLNRDWMPVQLKESEARIALFHEWRPQLLTDHHEMGGNSTFFFQPGIPSRNNPNTPEIVFDLTRELGTYHADELDGIGSGYYSEESYDDFYYGKGSTFPDINGAVGILFEQGSSRALKTEVVDGVLSYAFTVRNQVATAISTSKGAAHMREKFLRHMRDFYASAPEFTRQTLVKAYVLDASQYPNRAQHLVQNLMKHRIRVHELAAPVRVGDRDFAPDSAFIIPSSQQQTRFLKAVMERVTTFEDSLFYDISTWTMPLAYGVPSGEITTDPGKLLGPEIKSVSITGGELSGQENATSYLMEWGTYYAPGALYKILEAGIYPGVAKEPFTALVDGELRSFDRGTLVIPTTPRNGNPHLTSESVLSLMKRLVEEDHVRIYGVDTGLTPSGPDLGSRTFSVLSKPTIGLVSGEGISSNDMGELWFLMTERFGFEVSLLDANRLSRMDLGRYNTLVTVSGLPESAKESVQRWIRDGGLLIATESAASWAIRSELMEGDIREPAELDFELPYNQLSDARGAQLISGTIFEVELDTTHPLAFGYDERIATFRTSNTFIEPSETPGVTVGKYSDAPLLSGYISQPQLERVKGAAAILASRSGRGSIVLLADNPNFRAFWYGTNGLFFNALFFGRSF